MADTDKQNRAADAEPVFRPSKRRKFYRKRIDEDGEKEAEAVVGCADLSALKSESWDDLSSPRDDLESSGQSVADLLRLRKQVRARKGGIEFTNTTRPGHSRADSSQEPLSDALISHDELQEEIKAVTGRFAPQTGQVADVNKHM